MALSRRVVIAGVALVLLSAWVAACGPGGSSAPTPKAIMPNSDSSATSSTAIPAFATEIAGTILFYSAVQAEAHAGFKILQIDVTKFPVMKDANSGFVETFPEVGLPRVRQDALVVAGHETTMIFAQEPDGYPNANDQSAKHTTVTFGGFTGTLWQSGDGISFEFYTGQSLAGSPIRATVSALGDYSVDDIRHFVEALYFGS